MNLIFCALFFSGIWFGLADEGTRCYPSAALIKKAEFLSLKEKERVGGSCPEKDTTGQELLMFAFSARPC